MNKLYIPLNKLIIEGEIDESDKYCEKHYIDSYENHPNCPNNGKIYEDSSIARFSFCHKHKCLGCLKLKPTEQHGLNWCGHDYRCIFYKYLFNYRAGYDITYRYKNVYNYPAKIYIKRNKIHVVHQNSTNTRQTIDIDALPIETYYGLKYVCKRFLTSIGSEVFDYGKPEDIATYFYVQSCYGVSTQFADNAVAAAISLFSKIELVQCIGNKDNHRLHKWVQLNRMSGFLETLVALANLPYKGEYSSNFYMHCYLSPACGVHYTKTKFPDNFILYRCKQEKVK